MVPSATEQCNNVGGALMDQTKVHLIQFSVQEFQFWVHHKLARLSQQYGVDIFTLLENQGHYHSTLVTLVEDSHVQ